MEWILIPVALLTSTFSGIVGMGGGITLLAVMSEFYEPLLLIPIHGVVQWFSNSSRAVLSYEHIDWKIFGAYAGGAIIGAAIGSQFVMTVDQDLMKVLIGVFILFVTWVPRPKNIKKVKGKFFFLGTAATALSMFFGAVGPLTAPFYLNEGLNRLSIVATKASAQMLSHSAKVIAYIMLGTTLHEHWRMLLALIVVAVLGSYIGKRILNNVSEALFKRIYLSVITLLSFRMIYVGFIGL